MFAIQRIFGIVLAALQKNHAELYTLVLQTLDERTIGTFIGIIVGGLIFAAVNILQNKWLQSGDNMLAQPGTSADCVFHAIWTAIPVESGQ